MSITDELREFAPHLDLGKVALARWKEALLAIADRIDAEHERQMVDAFETRNSDENLEADGWVRLPKDADGEYIHIGDKVTCGASVWEVTGFRFTGGFWGICCTIFNDQGGSGTNVYPPSDLHHYHAPTVEDVLRQFLGECESAANLGYDEVPQEVFDDYVKRLQLRGDAE